MKTASLQRKGLSLLAAGALGAAAFTAGTTVPQAQATNHKIGFVNVQTVIEATPQYAPVRTLQQQAEAQLKPTADQITALQPKIAGNTATAAERQQYNTLVQTYRTRQEQFSTQINTQLEPILTRVNTAVANVARQQGFTVVMDRAVAAQSGLVIYANEQATDFTAAVVAAVRQ